MVSLLNGVKNEGYRDVARQSEGGVLSLINNFASKMKFYYTYILQSEKNPEKYYTGFTENLEKRLKSHNSGSNPHTRMHRPWRIKSAIAFTDRQRALDFEAYLKSPSGRAFAKKRL